MTKNKFIGVKCVLAFSQVCSADLSKKVGNKDLKKKNRSLPSYGGLITSNSSASTSTYIKTMNFCKRRRAKQNGLAVESFVPQSYGILKQRDVSETIGF